MWWNNLSTFEQITFVIAVTATALLVVFIILMIIGAATDADFDGGDVDLDSTSIDPFNDNSIADAGGLQIFTFRTLLVFLCIGGWAAFLFGGIDGLHPAWAGVIGGLIGAGAGVGAAFAFKAMFKLESSGNISYRYGIGKEAVVYLKIPKNLSGTGKVNATIQERFLEISAITSDDEDIPVGTRVYIIGVSDETTVIVSRDKLDIDKED